MDKKEMMRHKILDERLEISKALMRLEISKALMLEDPKSDTSGSNYEDEESEP